MPQFPDNIFTPRETENLPGIVYDVAEKKNMFSEDFQNLGGEINAIETALGINLANVVPPVKATGAEINTGTNDTKFATPKAIADSDIAFLSDIPAVPVKATGAEINTGTNDTKFATPKAIADSDIAFLSDIPSVPVKATGAEITTGTNDAKFVTPKAMADAGVNVPASGGASCLSLIPQATFPFLITNNTGQPSRTEMMLYKINIPFAITVNKLSLCISATYGAGIIKCALFSEDGQTRLFSLTSGTIDLNGSVYTMAVASVVIPAGFYWFAMLGASADVDVRSASYVRSTQGSVNKLTYDVASEPILEGNLTVTQDTIPSTITIASITNATLMSPIFRLDN